MRPHTSMDLPILMYHHLEQEGSPVTPYSVPASLFSAQLDALRRAGFETINLAHLFDALAGAQSLPPKPLVITFDDGYQSFHDLALPALTSYGMRATVFVVANEIGGWNRWDFDQGYPRRALMDASALREILAAGMEIGVHGWDHRDANVCTPAELTQEFVEAKSSIENTLGIVTPFFAFPYGRHSPAHFDLLRQSGYRGAVSVFPNQRTVTENPYALRRVYIHDGDGPLRTRLKASRLYLRYAAWRDRRAAACQTPPR